MPKPSVDPTTLPYRLCVGVALFNREGQVFVGRRIDTVIEAWQLPQGGIDSGESPETAAYRELAEEIGTNDADLLAETEDWLSYDLPPELIGKAWGGRYRGQRQKWFAMRFRGVDGDIDLQTAHPEFHDWRWVPLASIPDIIVPFKRALYSEIAARFAHLAHAV